MKGSNKLATVIKPRERGRRCATVRMCVWFPGVAAKVVFHQDESWRRRARHFPPLCERQNGSALALTSDQSSPCSSTRVALTTGEGAFSPRAHRPSRGKSLWINVIHIRCHECIYLISFWGIFLLAWNFCAAEARCVMLRVLFYLTVCLSKWLHVFAGCPK